jgi:hypothetical protein
MSENKFKIEVVADRTGHWNGNLMVYDTFDEAKTEAISLATRWILVTKARVVEFDEDGITVKETEVF